MPVSAQGYLMTTKGQSSEEEPRKLLLGYLYLEMRTVEIKLVNDDR